jgi:hypothetical protein
MRTSRQFGGDIDPDIDACTKRKIKWCDDNYPNNDVARNKCSTVAFPLCTNEVFRLRQRGL